MLGCSGRHASTDSCSQPNPNSHLLRVCGGVLGVQQPLHLAPVLRNPHAAALCSHLFHAILVCQLAQQRCTLRSFRILLLCLALCLQAAMEATLQALW